MHIAYMKAEGTDLRSEEVGTLGNFQSPGW